MEPPTCLTAFVRHALFHFIISRPTEIVGKRAAFFHSFTQLAGSNFYLKRPGLKPSLLLTRCWLGSRKLCTCSKNQRPLDVAMLIFWKNLWEQNGSHNIEPAASFLGTRKAGVKTQDVSWLHLRVSNFDPTALKLHSAFG